MNLKLKSLLRDMTNHLHNDHCNIWANMNDHPMHCDVFEHIDDEEKTWCPIDEFGIVLAEDMHLTDFFSHKRHIFTLTMHIVAFLKDNFKRGL